MTATAPSSMSVREVSAQLTAYRIGRSIRVWPADVNRYLRDARMWRP